MGKVKIGNCPKCRKGEIFLDKDQYGWFQYCLQCGYMRDLPDIVTTPVVKQPAEALKGPIEVPAGQVLAGAKT
jgi:hypothetical protein